MELYEGMVLASLVFLASLISVELGLSAAILEITLGVIGGNFLGLQQLEWVKYIAGFGGVLLTFMAGAEVDLKVLRERSKESITIGTLSFLAPFIGTLLFCRHVLGWDLKASQLAGIALSTTSLAVVYAVLVETGLTASGIGKIIMASTFVTDFGTAAGLSLLFVTPNIRTVWFVAVSLTIIGLALNGGLHISLRLLWANIGLFVALLAVKLGTKFVGVYPISRVFIPREATYTTLLMSTGLTMGTISSVFGYQSGIINQEQFSVLAATVVTSAIVPTFFAQRFFHPCHAFEAMGSEVEPDFPEAPKSRLHSPTDWPVRRGTAGSGPA